MSIKSFFDVEIKVRVTVRACSEEEAWRTALEMAQSEFSCAEVLRTVCVTDPERLLEYEREVAGDNFHETVTGVYDAALATCDDEIKVDGA